jgi:hypothetical protein
MLKKSSILDRKAFYPLLWSLYPILILFSNNLDQVSVDVVWRPLILSLAVTVLLLYFLHWRLHDWERAASITTLIIVLFYSYGHVYNLLEKQQIFGMILGRHRLLLPLWVAIGFILMIGIIRWRQRGVEWRRAMNLLAIILVGWIGVQITIHTLRGLQIQKEIKQTAPVNDAKLIKSDRGVPDVYYIILDGYARQDVLKDEYGLDNRPFLRQLETIGFVIPPCTLSNYAWTPSSLSSSFQMDYLEGFSSVQQVGDEHIDYRVFQEYIAHSPVRENFENLGYQFVAFETGWPFTEIADADLYIERHKNPLERYSASNGLTAFETTLSRTTLLLPLTELKTVWLNSLPISIRSPEEQHYDRLKFVMTELEKLPDVVPSPKFVFVHLVSPHAPYVFDVNGNYSDIGAEEVGYPNAIRYLDKWFLEFAQKLINSSAVAPIIIVQGDHGWYKGNRLAILNAYYLPEDGEKFIYDFITPVNSFRILFNHYFGGTYPLLEDRSYNSPAERQLELEPVTSSCVLGP